MLNVLIAISVLFATLDIIFRLFYDVSEKGQKAPKQSMDNMGIDLYYP